MAVVLWRYTSGSGTFSILQKIKKFCQNHKRAFAGGEWRTRDYQQGSFEAATPRVGIVQELEL